MAKNKTSAKKEHLTHELCTNKRAPVWTYLKTKSRGLMRRRSRHWRAPSSKIGKKSKQKTKASKGKRKGKK